jgi:hypothetical protein
VFTRFEMSRPEIFNIGNLGPPDQSAIFLPDPMATRSRPRTHAAAQVQSPSVRVWRASEGAQANRSD